MMERMFIGLIWGTTFAALGMGIILFPFGLMGIVFIWFSILVTVGPVAILLSAPLDALLRRVAAKTTTRQELYLASAFIGLPFGVLSLLLANAVYGWDSFVLVLPALAGGAGLGIGIAHTLAPSGTYVTSRWYDPICYGEKLGYGRAAWIGAGSFGLLSLLLLLAVCLMFHPEVSPDLVVLAFPVFLLIGAAFGLIHRLWLSGADIASGACVTWGIGLGASLGFLSVLHSVDAVALLCPAGALLGALTGNLLQNEELELRKPLVGPPRTVPPRQVAPPWFFNTRERDKEYRLFGFLKE